MWTEFHTQVPNSHPYPYAITVSAPGLVLVMIGTDALSFPDMQGWQPCCFVLPCIAGLTLSPVPLSSLMNIMSQLYHTCSLKGSPWDLSIWLEFKILSAWLSCDHIGEGNSKEQGGIFCEGGWMSCGSLNIGPVECWLDALGCVCGKGGGGIWQRWGWNYDPVGGVWRLWDKGHAGEAGPVLQIHID